MRKAIFFFLSTAILTTACIQEKVFPVDPEASQFLVLNGLFNPESPISVDLTKALAISDSFQIPKIAEPNIQITKNGQLICALDSSEIRMNLPNRFHPSAACLEIGAGDILELSADVEGLPPIKAIDTIPTRPQLFSYNFSLIEPVEQVGNPSFPRQQVSGIFELVLQDSLNYNEWYLLEAYAMADYFLKPSGEVIDSVHRQSLSMSILNPEINTTYGIFSDQQFSSQTPELLFKATALLRRKDSPLDQIFIEIRKVSYNYQQYYLKLFEHQTAAQDPFATFSPAYSNIEGGRGVWAAYHSIFITVPL